MSGRGGKPSKKPVQLSKTPEEAKALRERIEAAKKDKKRN